MYVKLSQDKKVGKFTMLKDIPLGNKFSLSQSRKILQNSFSCLCMLVIIDFAKFI